MFRKTAPIMAVLAFGWIGSPGQAQGPDPVFVDRMVLFSGERDLWPGGTIYAIGYNGGTTSDIRHGPTTIVITTTEGGGGGWRFTPHQFPVLDRYLADPRGRLKVECRWPDDKESGRVRVAFKSDTSVVGSSQSPFTPDRSLPTATTFEPADEEGWQRFSVPLAELESGSAALTAEAILFFTEKPTQLEIRRIEVSRDRNVSLELYCDPGMAWRNLVVRGRTEPAVEKVDIVIRDGEGKESVKSEAVKDGVFACVWNSPPLTEGRTNTVCAIIRDGQNPADRSIPIELDGTRGDNEHLWLRVKGKHIVTSPLAKGGERMFIPVGLGYSRDVIMSRDDDGVMKYCRDHHLNTVRFPFYLRYWNTGGEQIDLDRHIAEHIDPVVQAAKRHGLYVILDMHEYFEGGNVDAIERTARSVSRVGPWPEEVIQNWWIDGWVKVAEKYKDEPYVLGYELYNEMHDFAPEVVREYYTRCLKGIRQVDQRHIIIVGGWDWCHARSLEDTWDPVASAVDAPYNNVVFTTHEYPPDNQPWLIQEWMTAFRDRHNVPVMCTEFGAPYWANSETATRQGMAGILAMFAKEDIGWMIWALSRLADDPRNHNGVWPRDSLAYTDIWPPVARVMGSSLPERAPRPASNERQEN